MPKMGPFDNGKGIKLAFSELFIIMFFFFWLNLQNSLTEVHSHMKFGRNIEFGVAQVNQRHKPYILYRACIVDLLGLKIIMCGVYYCIVCTSNLDLVHFLFVSAL